MSGGNSKLKGVFGLIAPVFGAGRAFADVRKARGNGDKLALFNAIANILVVITGAALAIREFRRVDTEALEAGESGEYE